jgi:hypothetical protein
MRTAMALAFLLTSFLAPASAQSQQRAPAQQKPDADRLGLTCAQILQMTSSEWIAKITSIDASTADGNLRGIRVYGTCYDQRTDRLAASLAKTGKGPLMGARGNFRDFDQSLQNFTKKALAESEPPADAVKSAYAALYEKQFRYAFYQSYDQQSAKPSSSAAAKTGTKTDAPTPPPPPQPAAPSAPTSPETANASATNAPPPAKVVDPISLAKNHFGELLSDLPDDKMHDLHAAFGEVLVRNSVGASMQLAIYRYAIFLLEPLSVQPSPPLGSPAHAATVANQAQPFAPPPF